MTTLLAYLEENAKDFIQSLSFLMKEKNDPIKSGFDSEIWW
jgi:hypothetical protein